MKPAIVCVDDDPIVLASLGEQLNRSLGQDYDIELAASALEALDLLSILVEEGRDIPVIISDQQMPEMSGEKLLTQVHRQHPQILTILLTGYSSLEAVATAVNLANLYRFIAKPWDETDLLLTVEKALRAYFQGQELISKQQALSQAHVHLEKSLSLLQATLESTADGILVVDNNGAVTLFNQKLIELWKLEPDINSPEQEPRMLDAILDQMQDPELFVSKIGQWQQPSIQGRDGEVTLKNGKIIEYYSQAQCLGRENTGRVWSFHDITERRAAAETIHYQAHYDYLTGLSNRRQLNDQLAQLLENTQTQQESVAVLFIDLDHFKVINDTLGHVLGDLLLQQVVTRLKENCRSGDFIARWGGDEFIIILPHIACRERAAESARRLLGVLQPSFKLEEHSVRITCSIGIAIYPEDGQNTVALLKNADAALYQAKTRGRNEYQYYTPGLNIHSGKQLTLEDNLYRALEREEFSLYYQPQVDTTTGEITHMEALLRWQHPQSGFISPGTFVPLAEQKGLIQRLGKWVLETACRQAIAWQSMGLKPIVMAVNLSPRQLWHRQITETVEQILTETGLPPQWLELEITETAAMQEVDLARSVLLNFQQMGINIALDDFGTGYSSLSYLKRLPFHTLKIDQSFVRDLLNNPSDVAIVEALLILGRRLNRRVIAEGVETAEIKNLLQSLHCRYMQGYWFSRPLPLQEATQALMQNCRGKAPV